jgi:hypothetical protein
MRTKLKIAGGVLFVALGLWLTLRQPLPGSGLTPAWNCAASRALLCIQK